MGSYRLANELEISQFQRRFCKTAKDRRTIINFYRVEVELVEDSLPYQKIIGGDGKMMTLKGVIVMLKVIDDANKVVYYPVFSEQTAKRLLKLWKLQLPTKLSVFADASAERQDSYYDPLNVRLRTLIAYTRIFLLEQKRIYQPLPTSLHYIHDLLASLPNYAVEAELVKVVNDVIGSYLQHYHPDSYISCTALEDYICYLRNHYTMLAFKNSDFSELRQLLQTNFPNEPIYF